MMSNKNCRFAVLVAFCLCTLGVDAAPKLDGQLTQGSLIRGQIQPNSKVFLNQNPITVNPQGEFVFGFGRDAKLEHVLSWQLPDQENKDSIKIMLTPREYDVEYIEGVAQKYVTPPEAVRQRIRDDSAAVAKARKVSSQLRDFNMQFVMPSNGRISGVYGSQRFFNGEPRRPHFGIDIANKTGTPVYAPVGGIVTLVHEDMYYSGGTLIVDHGLGVSSTFIHLNKMHVKEGDRIEQGQWIADIGATGRVTGPHLDWRVNWFSERLDPGLLVAEKIEYQPK